MAQGAPMAPCALYGVAVGCAVVTFPSLLAYTPLRAHTRPGNKMSAFYDILVSRGLGRHSVL